MADAKLVIEIEDDKGGGPAPAAPVPPMSPAGSVPTGPASSSSRPAGGSAWDSLPEWKPAGSVPAKPEPMPGEAAVREATIPPMPGSDPLRSAVDERAEARERQKVERQIAREAELERRERAAEARRITAEGERDRMEREREQRAVAKAAQAEAMRQAKLDADWDAAKLKVKANPGPTRQEEADTALEETRKRRRLKDEAAAKEKTPEAMASAAYQKAGGYMGKNAQRLGDVIKATTGSGEAAVAGAAESATAGLKRLGPYGMAAGIALQSVAKVGSAASEAVEAFVKRGKELSGFNGQLAGASATADLRSMMADFREADQLGPQLAEMIQMQSQSEAVFREIMLPVKAFMMDEVKSFMVGLMMLTTNGLEGFNKLLDKFGLESEAIKKALENIRKVLLDRDIGGDPMEIWRKAAEDLVPIPVAPVPVAGLLRVPLLMRDP